MIPKRIHRTDPRQDALSLVRVLVGEDLKGEEVVESTLRVRSIGEDLLVGVCMVPESNQKWIVVGKDLVTRQQPPSG